MCHPEGQFHSKIRIFQLCWSDEFAKLVATSFICKTSPYTLNYVSCMMNDDTVCTSHGL